MMERGPASACMRSNATSLGALVCSRGCGDACALRDTQEDALTASCALSTRCSRSAACARTSAIIASSSASMGSRGGARASDSCDAGACDGAQRPSPTSSACNVRASSSGCSPLGEPVRYDTGANGSSDGSAHGWAHSGGVARCGKQMKTGSSGGSATRARLVGCMASDGRVR